MTESDKKSLLAKLIEFHDSISPNLHVEGAMKFQEWIRRSIEIVESIETEPSLEELICEIIDPYWDESSIELYFSPEDEYSGDCFCATADWKFAFASPWKEPIKESVKKLKALIDKR